ncbi:hypothetical protein SERLA73DRAFT_44019 [Serpula lacrymans var. lacrymans S7.3]|uniref:NAD-dependent epimerase/dehydratase domain-containing protein n=2 Tax=Serpula lacrymans var. lacrymans TaxID=341189 RepID=F8PFN6_SERL3|nr:uncharacterized protein SERLADRAFT_364924 [Serpula lacrymans var. lacrymans S7.9]EGO05325.1 hypothetical protein SERLA73DRAFT_44019 [Serpula lacrymans var. lacrymans S7.3]EGO31178.1 hypothetical protein SERLADRAFT_364924 [Serpula lacrymans var. lacrymans S7.9]
MSQNIRVVVCGAGFLGSHIAKTIAAAQGSNFPNRLVQLSSRHPQTVHAALETVIDHRRLLPPQAVDITKPQTLDAAFHGANVVVSLVGIMNGTPEDFERIQWRGAENIANAARRANAKLVHFSAIGADKASHIPYVRTKALGEEVVFEACPDATIIRPSLVFGPGDSFFTRFARLSQLLPFLPVFGGGTSRFQPDYVGDLARAVEIISRDSTMIKEHVAGKILEAGGPEVFTYREIMNLVLQYTRRRRPIISIPFGVGMLQGSMLERLPQSLFTVTRAQVEQLKSDNVVESFFKERHNCFEDFVTQYSGPLTSVHDVLPTYIS